MKCLGLLCLSEFAKVSETSLRRFIRKLLDTCYKLIHHILSVLKKMIIYLLRFFFISLTFTGCGFFLNMRSRYGAYVRNMLMNV